MCVVLKCKQFSTSGLFSVVAIAAEPLQNGWFGPFMFAPMSIGSKSHTASNSIFLAAKKGETQKLGKLDEVVGRTASVVVYGGGKAIWKCIANKTLASTITAVGQIVPLPLRQYRVQSRDGFIYVSTWTPLLPLYFAIYCSESNLTKRNFSGRWK